MPKETPQPTHRSTRLAAVPEGPPPQVVQRRPTKKITRGKGGKEKQSLAQKMGPEGEQMDVDETTLESSPGETDSAKVGQPISASIHPNLQSAWRVNRNLPMCFLFDSISPARRFKRGMLFSDEADFPIYSHSEAGDVTETDAIPALMQYLHDDKYKYVYAAPTHHMRLTPSQTEVQLWMQDECRQIYGLDSRRAADHQAWPVAEAKGEGRGNDCGHGVSYSRSIRPSRSPAHPRSDTWRGARLP